MNNERPMYYDKDGKPITFEQWCEYWEADRDHINDFENSYRCVAQDVIGEHIHVSTVWLGLDHNFMMKGPPIIFETMIFDDTPGTEDNDKPQWRYSTIEEAHKNHARIVKLLRQQQRRNERKKTK